MTDKTVSPGLDEERVVDNVRAGVFGTLPYLPGNRFLSSYSPAATAISCTYRLQQAIANGDDTDYETLDIGSSIFTDLLLSGTAKGLIAMAMTAETPLIVKAGTMVASSPLLPFAVGIGAVGLSVFVVSPALQKMNPYMEQAAAETQTYLENSDGLYLSSEAAVYGGMLGNSVSADQYSNFSGDDFLQNESDITDVIDAHSSPWTAPENQ